MNTYRVVLRIYFSAHIKIYGQLSVAHYSWVVVTNVSVGNLFSRVKDNILWYLISGTIFWVILLQLPYFVVAPHVDFKSLSSFPKEHCFKNHVQNNIYLKHFGIIKNFIIIIFSFHFVIFSACSLI